MNNVSDLSKVIDEIAKINISNEHPMVREQEDKLSTTKRLIALKNIVESKLKSSKHKIDKLLVKWGALADSIQLDKDIAQEEWEKKDDEIQALLYNDNVDIEDFVSEELTLFRERDEALQKVISLEQVLKDMKDFKIDSDKVSWRYSHTFDSGWRSSAFDLPDTAEEYRRESRYVAQLMELASLFQNREAAKKVEEVKAEVKEEVKPADTKKK